MNDYFKDLVVIELAGVLAGPSAGLFFAELGATVIKIENPNTQGDVTRSWKLASENQKEKASAYYWSVNAGKKVRHLDLQNPQHLQECYDLVKTADVVITNYKLGDYKRLKIDYETLKQINPLLIYASINGFGTNSPRTAYDLILQAESGFMFMNGEKQGPPLKMPVALIDLLAGHQLKEAILLALIKKYKTNKGTHVSVSLFDSAIASLANQATNWLIAHHLPNPQGSLHPNIAPYGELFTTKDGHSITFAIGSEKQFKNLCLVLNLTLFEQDAFKDNQQRVIHRAELFSLLNACLQHYKFEDIYQQCIDHHIPIGKIRTLQEVFELPETKHMLHHFTNQTSHLTSVKSIAFQWENEGR